MLVREQVHEAVDTLDREFTMDQLFERLSFIESVKEGLKDLEEGNTLTEEEFENEMKKW
jgi:predicted transcriptional regulator